MTLILGVFFVLVIWALKPYWQKNNRQASEDFTTFVREQLKNQLKPLPKLDYEKHIGGQPSGPLLRLGRALFNDPILSRNNDISCATCHLSNHGFADGNPLPFGAMGKGGPTGDSVGRGFAEGHLSLDRNCGDDGMGSLCHAPMFRNALSTVNVGFRANFARDEGLLWDGRFGKLSFQVTLPIHTAAEMCGDNPIPHNSKVFAVGSDLFKTPVTVLQSHHSDPYTGKNLDYFNAPAETISGLPKTRANGAQVIPNRNECMAIAIAKVRSVSLYRELFKQSFGAEGVDDIKIGKALAAFVSTHVSKNTPYDKFVDGQGVLTQTQLEGLLRFALPLGKKVKFGQKNYQGFGCTSCHEAPLFGGNKFYSLGVASDNRSVLAQTSISFTNSSFFTRVNTQRGDFPKCHIVGQSVDIDRNYAPDMGRAFATTKFEDCFKFRVPPLRNVIETFPYFHHGRGRQVAMSQPSSLEKRAYLALYQVVKYHLRGPININIVNRRNASRSFSDEMFLYDNLIPIEMQNFTEDRDNHQKFPISASDEELYSVVDFIAYGLWDKNATRVGDLKNDVSHPKKVPSGFLPTVTRDRGHQLELPPNFN